MRILVTGGGGFLGSWICRQLRAREAEVIAFQRGAAPELERLGVQVIRGDLVDRAALTSAIAACEAVIHVAGKAGAWGPREEYWRVNVEGTQSVLDACRKAGVSRLVYTSSPSVVHGGGDIEGGDESLPYPAHYAAAYPESKAEAERRVLAANDRDLATISLRPHLVWGPGDRHLLPRLLQRARSGVLRLPGADKLIDTVYVENAATAHLNALDALDTNPNCRGRAYFISNAEPWPQARIITALLQAADCEARIQPMAPWLARAAGAVCELAWRGLRLSGEPPITRWAAEQLSTAHWYDLSAARRELGYVPTISMETGLERLRESLRRGL